ncbi:ABC transporter permease [Nesterenkonia alba]|uniref:ABC transporter permease n=1 Tax=Nesterenkonia alba TaxID=515814 RepID=UPI0003B76A9D|nr:ABC transporter permease [Nesterenkonia alba]
MTVTAVTTQKPETAAQEVGAHRTPTQVLQELEAKAPKESAKSRKVLSEDRKASPVLVNLLRIAVVVVVFGGWELGTRTGHINAFFWSSPSRIFAKAQEQFAAGTFWGDIAYTMTSSVVGFILGTLIGTALGLSFWWSKTYAQTAEPFVIMFEALPKIALAPLIVLVLGVGIDSKIALAAALVLAIQALNAYSGVRTVDRDIIRMMNSLGASRMKIFRSVVIPSTLPWIISGLRVTIGLALAGAIVGEFIGSSQGLGYRIMYAGSVYDIALVWLGVFVLAILSVLLYIVVAFLEKRLGTQLSGKK